MSSPKLSRAMEFDYWDEEESPTINPGLAGTLLKPEKPLRQPATSLDPSLTAKNIFLLEFFIHYITGERLAELSKIFVVPTSILLQFLDCGGADEVEEIITPHSMMFSPSSEVASADTEHFYSGRSILFSEPEIHNAHNEPSFRIMIDVYKKIPQGIGPDIAVGSGGLDLTNEFNALRKAVKNSWNHDLPLPKQFEGPVQLYYNEKPVVQVMVFARLSAFAGSIITEFNNTHQASSSSFVFMGSEQKEKEKLAYKCRIFSQSRINMSDNIFYPLLAPSQQNYCRPCGAIFDKQNGGKLIESSRGTSSVNPVVLKLSGLIMDADGNINKPSVTVDTKSDRQLVDDKHDVFVLRIGKRGIVGEGEKSDIQVEMRTPKGPTRRPPIRYETREIQTDIDQPEASREQVEIKKIGKKRMSKKKKKRGKKKGKKGKKKKRKK